MSRSKWKSPYIDINIIKKMKKQSVELPIYTNSRSSLILPSFVGWTFFVHSGREYNKILISANMVGRKLGEFVFTRRVGNIHTSKKKKK